MAGRTYNRPYDRSAFEVAIVCALTVEADAIISLFDNLWENEDSYGKADGDTNSYTTGRMGAHNVVLVHMARMGKVSAANVSANLRFSFRHIHLCLLVGICGAVPFVEDREVLLGDVVIGTQVVQSDFGRQYPDTFVRKSMSEDALGRPNPEIGAFLASLQTRAAQNSLRDSIRMNLDALYESRYINPSSYPGIHDDRLFEPTYRHKHQRKESCTICAECVSPDDGVCTNSMSLSCAELGCDASKLIPRARVQMAIDAGSNMSCQPRIHFGAMASGDQVIKSAQHRDRIAEDARVIAFEMEGAGLWDTMPTIVVKGVCDYADSHKSKAWQGYAATTAAACAKAILRLWRPSLRAQRVEYPGSPPRSSPTRQVFSGHFTAGKNIHNSGTYTAGSMNF